VKIDAREVVPMNLLISVVTFVVSLVSPACTQTQHTPPAPPPLSAEGRAAYDQLAAADVFAIGPVGVAGTTSADELALRRLLGEPHAAVALTSLAESATLAGKLYGLAGLSMKDRESAVALAHKLEARDGATEVQEVSGCIVMQVKVSDVVGRIERGEYAERLERPARPVDRY
jgi:hypothetical protein